MSLVIAEADRVHAPDARRVDPLVDAAPRASPTPVRLTSSDIMMAARERLAAKGYDWSRVFPCRKKRRAPCDRTITPRM